MGFVCVFFRRSVWCAQHTSSPLLCVFALLLATTGATATLTSGFDRTTTAHGAHLGTTRNMLDHVAGAGDVPIQMSARPSGYRTQLEVARGTLQQPVRFEEARRFSDMYSVTWVEIPMPESTPADPHLVTADSITNDGTIAGRATGALVLWHPDTQAWEEVPKQLGAPPAFISPTGSSVVTTDELQEATTNVLTWNRVAGWQSLAGNSVAQSQANNVSRNFRFVVGAGNDSGEPAKAWIWAIDGGIQQLLQTPYSDGAVAAFAVAVSDDGNVVVGNAIRPPPPGEFLNDYVATRWDSGGLPVILRDPDGNELYEASACNVDCSIIFGSGVWFLRNDGGFGFLGTIPDGYPTPGPYGAYYVSDASSDGSIVVGLYSQNVYPTNPNSETYANRPYVWTRATGMTSLRSLTTDLDIGDEDWGHIATMRLSPDGRLVLISGERRSGQSRVVVLHLTPRAVRPAAGHSTHAWPTPPRVERADPHGSQLRLRVEPGK